MLRQSAACTVSAQAVYNAADNARPPAVTCTGVVEAEASSKWCQSRRDAARTRRPTAEMEEEEEEEEEDNDYAADVYNQSTRPTWSLHNAAASSVPVQLPPARRHLLLLLLLLLLSVLLTLAAVPMVVPCRPRSSEMRSWTGKTLTAIRRSPGGLVCRRRGEGVYSLGEYTVQVFRLHYYRMVFRTLRARHALRTPPMHLT
jgi:hypothetical protein